MNTTREYSSALRKQQTDLTRERIADAAMDLISESPESVTHEAVAAKAGVAARTVYRHFPTRTDLVQAMWQKLKERTRTQFPESEEELLESAPELFRSFDRNEALVRAFLSSGAGAEVRERGALEGRPAMQRCLEQATDGLSAERKAQAVAVFLALYSAPSWQLMRDRGGLGGRQTGQALTWALRSLLDSLKSEKKKGKRT